jgi:hypothetical protein
MTRAGERPSTFRFSTGLLLIVLNFVLGKIALPLLIMEPTLSIVIYLISWGMLVAGLVLCGREGWHAANRHAGTCGKTIVRAFQKLYRSRA